MFERIISPEQQVWYRRFQDEHCQASTSSPTQLQCAYPMSNSYSNIGNAFDIFLLVMHKDVACAEMWHELQMD